MQCQMCNKELLGKQTKFCSKKCCQATVNNKHQDYVAQQRRGQLRKDDLVAIAGGCCKHCGYNKNTAALCFHHTDPTIKKFNLDIRKCSNSTWEALLAESMKCILLCANCHAELHNPDR